MIFTAHRVRTTAAILTAGSAVVAAMLLGQRTSDHCAVPSADSSPYISASFATRLLAPDQLDQDIAVTLTMPKHGEARRPNLGLAVVIDRSGSMAGAPMDNAKAAAAELVDQLGPNDSFTIVTYSSGAETVMAMTPATPDAKQRAHAAIATIEADGGTCISCGINAAEVNLAARDIDGRGVQAAGVRRMVLISDGQANEGLWDRDELAQLATATANEGISLSAVGVGLDFDELTMIRLAEVGRGHYYFVEDTQQLAAMFATELSGLADTVATDVRLTISPDRGTQITNAYGYPLARTADGAVVIPVADMVAGETRKVVVHAQLGRVDPARHASLDRGMLPAGTFRLEWRTPATSRHETAQVTLGAEVSTDAQAIVASTNVDAQSAIAEARAATVLEDAAITYDKYGQQAAQKVIERHMVELREQHVAPQAMQRIEGAANAAIDGFAQPPEKARKVTRTHAYELAR